jgi:hypothetical protein
VIGLADPKAILLHGRLTRAGETGTRRP